VHGLRAVLADNGVISSDNVHGLRAVLADDGVIHSEDGQTA
jgi:hypothetical protein